MNVMRSAVPWENGKGTSSFGHECWFGFSPLLSTSKVSTLGCELVMLRNKMLSKRYGGV
jgi:hypothetical protein